MATVKAQISPHTKAVLNQQALHSDMNRDEAAAAVLELWAQALGGNEQALGYFKALVDSKPVPESVMKPES